MYCIYTKPELYGRYIDDCISATSTREELTQFISAINSFHLALKYTWEISDTSSAFLDIKISIEGNVLCTSVHNKPTDSQLLVVFIFTSTTRQEFHTFFSFSDFVVNEVTTLIFPKKSQALSQFFDKRGCSVSVI